MVCRTLIPLAALVFVAVILTITSSSVHAHGENGLSLRVAHSGKCMDLKQASQTNGAKIQQYQRHGGANQRFEIIHHPDAYHSLKFLHSGKCLTAIGSTNGTQLEQQTCTYSDAQKFTLGA